MGAFYYFKVPSATELVASEIAKEMKCSDLPALLLSNELISSNTQVGGMKIYSVKADGLQKFHRQLFSKQHGETMYFGMRKYTVLRQELQDIEGAIALKAVDSIAYPGIIFYVYSQEPPALVMKLACM